MLLTKEGLSNKWAKVKFDSKANFVFFVDLYRGIK